MEGKETDAVAEIPSEESVLAQFTHLLPEKSFPYYAHSQLGCVGLRVAIARTEMPMARSLPLCAVASLASLRTQRGGQRRTAARRISGGSLGSDMTNAQAAHLGAARRNL